MAGTSINCLAIVLKELGWSYTRLIAELRRQAAIDGIVLPKTESLIRLISRWVNNHQQPDDFYRDLLSRATGRHRFELFSDEAAVALLAARTNAGIAPIVAVGSHEDMNRRQLLARSAALAAALAADPVVSSPGRRRRPALPLSMCTRHPWARSSARSWRPSGASCWGSDHLGLGQSRTTRLM